ncbi:hypothetical protein MJO29_012531 [Puccinia striiformis f. sp. tritici]|nr:hypothetical protein MJO29_012531 [Puccinia striiformis f. sp. tritici]
MASSIQQLRSDIAKLRQLTLDIQNSKNINKNEHQEQQPSLSRDPRLKKSVTSNTIHRSATAPPPPPVTAPIVSATVPEQLHNSDPRYFHQPVHSSSRPTSHSHNRGGRSVGEEEEEEEEGVIKENEEERFRSPPKKSFTGRSRERALTELPQTGKNYPQEEEEEGGNEGNGWRSDNDEDHRLEIEHRRYQEEMKRYFEDLEVYKRKMRHRLAISSSHHSHDLPLQEREEAPIPRTRIPTKRRNSTDEYFMRSLETVEDTSTIRTKRFSLAEDRSTLPESHHTDQEEEGDMMSGNHKKKKVDPERETVEAATVLLGLGSTRPPSISHCSTTTTTINTDLDSHMKPPPDSSLAGAQPGSPIIVDSHTQIIDDLVDIPHATDLAAISLLSNPH